jgi:hypothetical protein
LGPRQEAREFGAVGRIDDDLAAQKLVDAQRRNPEPLQGGDQGLTLGKVGHED